MNTNSLGYIKYDGERLNTGAFDARKAAQALLGIDEALRQYIIYQTQDLRGTDFEIPIKINKGSWVVSIPIDVEHLFQLGIGIAATAYVTNAAKKMAERDFNEIGFKDLLKNGMDAIKWIARIGKHLGGVLQRKFERVKYQNNNELIGIQNSEGVYLFIPKKHFDFYVRCNPKILEKITINIDPSLTLTIASIHNGKFDEELITYKDRHFFVTEDTNEGSGIVLSELTHGQQVELEGEVTRENKTSNSMGFKYKGHILSAYPISGNIIPFKPMLFEKCKLVGFVDRLDENGKVGSRKPKLRFESLISIEKIENHSLF